MLKKEITILVALFIISQSEILANGTGSPLPFSDFSNPEFQKVFDAVKSSQIQVVGWSPSRATRQVTNQVKYTFRLVSDVGEIADAVGVVNSQGDVKITSFNIIVGRKSNSEKANDVTATGFKPFTDYENSSFQKALDQAKWQHFYLLVSYKLNRTELFVSPRFYYFKFYFSYRQNVSRILRLTECISFETPAIPIPHPSSGGFSYNDPYALGNNYYTYNQLLNFEPNYSTYKIITLMQNPNDGNYIFVLEKNVGNYDRKKLYINNTEEGFQTIVEGSEDKSGNYAQQVVDQVEAFAKQTWTDLQDYKLETVENLRISNTGLRLTLTKGALTKIVELDLQGEDETLILYEDV